MYIPAEDSYFLSEILNKELRKLTIKNKNLKFLDMGCGSAIQAETALKSGVKIENILCIDIDNYAFKEAMKKGFIAIKSDLFKTSKLKEMKFDIISFNPPYLPDDKYDKQKDTSGGKKGDETILNFIKQSKNNLNKNGMIFLLFSSLTPQKKIMAEIKKKFNILKREEKKLFFEKLFVYILEAKKL